MSGLRKGKAESEGKRKSGKGCSRSWWRLVILMAICHFGFNLFIIQAYGSSVISKIIYFQLFCNNHDPMCFLIHYETLDRMRVVRTALLQWRHHHRPLLVEVPENLRKWEDGENIISIIITIIKLFVANPQKLRKCQYAVIYQEHSIYISLRFVLTIKKQGFIICSAISGYLWPLLARSCN